MKLYQPILLPFYQELVDFINLKYAEKLIKKSDTYIAHFIDKWNIDDSLLEKMNSYFESRGLEFARILMFFRKNVDYSEMHVDLINESEKWQSSLVVPILNYENTYMYWFDGDYSLAPNNSHANVPYFDINWHGEKKLVEEVEILGPTLCRVDVPHGARSASEDSVRLVATIRFKNNLPFEEVVKRLL